MTERIYRQIMGLTLIVLLFFQLHTSVLVYIGIVACEGITGWRIPLLVSRLRYRNKARQAVPEEPCTGWIAFDLERALRLVIACLLLLSSVALPERLWFLPWFIGFALITAGVTGVCPMALVLKKLGFRAEQRTSIADGLTTKWQESIAVKITAATLFVVMLVAFVVTVLSLWNAGKRVEQEYAERADRLAYRIIEDIQNHVPHSLGEFTAVVKRELVSSRFEGALVKYGEQGIRIGKTDPQLVPVVRSVPVVGAESGLSERSLVITLYHSPIDRIVLSRRNTIFLMTGGAALVFGIFLNWVILKFVKKPVSELVDATRAVMTGDLGVRVQNVRQDEFGSLSQFFNRMLDQIVQELTVRRQAEERLLRSNEFIKTALDSMNDSICIVNARDFTIQGVNERFLAEHGVRQEEVLGKTCYEVTHRRTTPCTPPSDVCPLIETVTRGVHASAEHVHYNHNGSNKTVYAEVSTSPIRDKDGYITQVVHVSRDITERKRAEELLRRNEEELAHIFDSIRAGVLLINPRRHEIVYANAIAATMIGVPKKDILGRVCHHFVCPAEEGKCPITDRHEVVHNSERILLRAGGRSVPILKSAVVVNYQGEEHIIESFIDISAIKKTEQNLRDANEELQAFVYSASHDLRGPLVNIRGYATELTNALQSNGALFERCLGHLDEGARRSLAQVLGDEVPTALQFINTSADRLDRLISAMLQLSHVSRRDLRPEPVDVVTLVRSILSALDGQIKEKQVSVTVGALPAVIADTAALQQILHHLIDNAVKYLVPGRDARIEISGEHKADHTLFQIRDNGRGISEDDQQTVFAFFRRAGLQNEPGDGMGLPYVKTLVRRHGGRIWCESKPGEGTVFCFTIPNVLQYAE
jgi:PAS domain S-box-containing protein